MSFWNTTFGFVTAKMPGDARGEYLTGSILLRVLGWVQAISLVLGFVFALIFIPIMFLIIAGDGSGAGEILAIMVPIMIVVMMIVVAVSLLVLWWHGWTLHRWAEQDPRGLNHFRIIPVVFLSLFGLSILLMIGMMTIMTAIPEADAPYPPWMFMVSLLQPQTIITVGAYIWMLVIAGRPALHEVFEAA